MLSRYVQAAMHRAVYEIIEEDETFFGSIPDCQGVWASAETLEACRDQLQEVLEGWIVLGLRNGHTLPVIDTVDLTPELKAIEQEQEVA